MSNPTPPRIMEGDQQGQKRLKSGGNNEVPHRYFDLEDSPNKLFRPRRLYERAPVTNLFRVLNESAEAQLYTAEKHMEDDDFDFCLVHVYGPPGTGKSSAAWKWAHEASRAVNCPMVYIRCSLNDCLKLIHGTQGRGTTIIHLGLEGLVESLFPGEAYHRVICVFDQALQENIQKFLGVIHNLVTKGAVVILVSSEGINLNAGSFQEVKIVHYRVPGWTLEEYKCACDDRNFFESIKARAFGVSADYDQRDQLLDNKFSLAGRSARFMFWFNDSTVKKEITWEIAEFQPTIENVERALRAPKCRGAVNTLISWHDPDFQGPTPQDTTRSIRTTFYDDGSHAPTIPESRTGLNTKNCFVSKFAAQGTIDHISAPSSKLWSMGQSIGEPTIIGYAFERRFKEFLLNNMHTQRDLNFDVSLLNGDKRDSEPWPISEILSGDAFDIMKNGSFEVGTWFWCVGQTEAYDAIVMYHTGCIRFVQLTVANSHSFKISAIDGFLQKLLRENITFTYVDYVVVRPARPDDDCTKFRLDPPLGTLARYNDFYGEKWASGDTCRDQARITTLGWV